jgi:hypothetical protein
MCRDAGCVVFALSCLSGSRSLHICLRLQYRMTTAALSQASSAESLRFLRQPKHTIAISVAHHR